MYIRGNAALLKYLEGRRDIKPPLQLCSTTQNFGYHAHVAVITMPGESVGPRGREECALIADYSFCLRRAILSNWVNARRRSEARTARTDRTIRTGGRSLCSQRVWYASPVHEPQRCPLSRFFAQTVAICSSSSASCGEPLDVVRSSIYTYVSQTTRHTFRQAGLAGRYSENSKPVERRRRKTTTLQREIISPGGSGYRRGSIMVRTTSQKNKYRIAGSDVAGCVESLDSPR